MKLRTRALTSAVVGAVALSTAAVVAPAATAAPNSYAYNAARWLDDQLTDGVVHNDQWDFDDYGLSLDVFFTLRDLDTRPAAQAKIVAAVSDHASDYAQYVYDGVTYDAPASAAKLATAVELTGGDPTAVDGVDLVSIIEKNTDDTTGATAGAYGGVGQAWATRGLVLTGSSEATASVGFLLAQQCPNGGFKQIYGGDCPAGLEVDATSFAIRTLLDAKEAGIGDVSAALAEAQSALLAGQGADGSFTNAGTANTNSTGLAATALRSLGQTGASGSAAAWLVSQQVTDAVAEDSKLSHETGAIAFNADALSTGKAEGITTETRDQWIRATAQAAAGIQGQLPAASVKVTAPSAFVAAGSTVTVTATGLTAGEKFTAAIAGGGKATGTVGAGGKVSASLKTPAGTANRVVTVTGSRSTRAGGATARVLGAKTLTVKPTLTKVKAGKYQSVRASGLAAREPVRVYYRGKLVKRGTASATGTYYYKFKVGTKKGSSYVSVYGTLNTRKGGKSFKVVK